jgi:hypothetical protein
MKYCCDCRRWHNELYQYCNECRAIRTGKYKNNLVKCDQIDKYGNKCKNNVNIRNGMYCTDHMRIISYIKNTSTQNDCISDLDEEQEIKLNKSIKKTNTNDDYVSDLDEEQEIKLNKSIRNSMDIINIKQYDKISSQKNPKYMIKTPIRSKLTVEQKRERHKIKKAKLRDNANKALNETYSEYTLDDIIDSDTDCDPYNDSDPLISEYLFDISKTFKKTKKSKAVKCQGMINNFKKCARSQLPNSLYCKVHSYYYKLTKEQIISINNCDKKMIACTRCKHWHPDIDYEHCEMCRLLSKEHGKIKRAKIIKCIAIDRYGNKCNYNQRSCILLYCKYHAHMEAISTDQLVKMRLCLGCIKIKLIDDLYQQCEECKNRRIFNKDKMLEKINKYKYDISTYIKPTLEEYNGPDHRFHWKAEQESKGLYICDNFLYGCKNDTKDNYKYCIMCRSLLHIRIYTIKRSARNRRIEFKLTNTQIIELINNPCTYCGKYAEVANNNSIDRIDSKGIYETANVCSSCIECNLIKFTHSVDDFIQYCTNIVNNYPAKYKCNDNVQIKNYSFWIKTNVDRNVIIELKENEYYEILEYACMYCGNTNSNNNGLDRIVNINRHYNLANVVACCSICNMMKKMLAVESFINRCKSIVKFNKQNLLPVQ